MLRGLWTQWEKVILGTYDSQNLAAARFLLLQTQGISTLWNLLFRNICATQTNALVLDIQSVSYIMPSPYKYSPSLQNGLMRYYSGVICYREGNWRLEVNST